MPVAELSNLVSPAIPAATEVGAFERVLFPVQHKNFSPQEFYEACIPRDPRSLREISEGVGVSPSTETYRFDRWGDIPIRDPQGRIFQVFKLTLPDREDAPPVALSINWLKRDRVKSVLHFDVLHHADLEERFQASLQLARIEPLLRDPDRFHDAVGFLRHLAREGVLAKSEAGAPHMSEFAVSSESATEVEQHLREWLDKRRVNVRNWGKGSAKSVDRLAEEVLKGEVRISCEYGDVYFDKSVVVAWVEDPSGAKRLIETGQTFLDGRPQPFRQRLEFGGLLAEKLSAYGGHVESAEQGLAKLMREELQIGDLHLCSVRREPNFFAIKPCCDYPSPKVFARLTFVPFVVRLHPSQVQPYYEEWGRNLYVRADWIENVADRSEVFRRVKEYHSAAA